MKYVVLLLKFVALIVLVMFRLGEWDMYGFLKPKYRESMSFYMDALLSIAIFLLLLDFLQVIVVGIYRRRNKVRGDDNFTIGIGHIYSLILAVGLIVGVLSLFRLNVREVFLSVSIIFSGLAILTKDYVSNLINGMITTFSGQLSLGDSISIGTHKGKIIDITLQNIHLLNDDDDVIYIPNNTLLTSEVINYTKREIKRTSIDFEISLKYLTTIEELEKTLIETLAPVRHFIKDESFYLRVAEVRKDALALKFQYILKEPNKDLERLIRRRVIRSLVEVISGREKIVDNIPDFPEEPLSF
jgi:small-conductance mechanosensitive channel